MEGEGGGFRGKNLGDTNFGPLSDVLDWGRKCKKPTSGAEKSC